MPVDPKNVNIKDLTKIQVEDIVKGWIRFIKKLLKSHENKVRRFKAGFCFLFFVFLQNAVASISFGVWLPVAGLS